MSAPELVHFATATVKLAEPLVITGGPVGTRIIAVVESMDVTGEKLNATLATPASADWLTIGPDGTYGTLDVRLTIRTDDDVLIHMEYCGRIDLTTGRIVSAPLFQCGDERYDWLNRMQAIGDGTNTPEALVYELYEVKLN